MVRNWCYPVLRVTALIAVMIFGFKVAIAEPDQTSADHIMPACCVAALPVTFSNMDESKEEVSRTSFCVGIIVGLSYAGAPFGVCPPVGATTQQAVHVVVQYIDGHPERMQENFEPLAVEALRGAWPCRDLARQILMDRAPVTTW